MTSVCSVMIQPKKRDKLSASVLLGVDGALHPTCFGMAPKVMKKAKTVMKSAPKSKKPKKKANKLPNITDTNGGGSFPWVLVGSGESWSGGFSCDLVCCFGEFRFSCWK